VVGAGVKKCHPEGAQSRVSCERQRASLRGDAEGRQSAALPPPPLGAAMEAEGSQAVTGVGELPEPGRALMTERRGPLCVFGRERGVAPRSVGTRRWGCAQRASATAATRTRAS